MRIVGGEFRGRPLATPRSNAIRPTTDRTREALFNVLAHAYAEHLAGARVLDLFAGTGALGPGSVVARRGKLPVHRRIGGGAGSHPRQCRGVRPAGAHEDFRRDATSLGGVGTILPFGVLFADPPYGKGFGEQALESALEGGWLLPGALCVVEETGDVAFAPPSGFDLLDERSYGDTVMRIFKAA